jgi:hypothetical protein
VPAAAVAVVLVVLLVAGTIGVGKHRTSAQAPHRRTQTHTSGTYVTVPTLPQLLSHFAVLRRPQSAADRAWRPPGSGDPASRQLPGYTRLLERLAGGVRLFLTVELFSVADSLDQAAGTVSMSIWFVHPGGATDGLPYSPNVASYTIWPASMEGRWLSVIPDGVSAVKWTFACVSVNHQCRLRRPGLMLTVPVRNNIALLDGAHVNGCSGDPCIPMQVQWLSGAKTVHRFSPRDLKGGKPQPFALGPGAPA